MPRRRVIVTILGAMQILAWGSSFFLLAVLKDPIAAETGWPVAWVVAGLSLSLLTSAIAAPAVGRAIERRGGRPVLAGSSALIATGLLVLAAAPYLAVFLAGWIVIGVGTAAGLYDAAFATLGRLYGETARAPIAAVTLFGGLASSFCWPLSAYLVATFGWRGTCVAYAALHVFIAVPLYLLAMPREAERLPAAVDARNSAPPGLSFAFVVLAATSALTTLIASVNAVHLLTFLRDRGMAEAAAVALGALVGPAQVAARAVEMATGRHHHPIWTLASSTALLLAGIGLFWTGVGAVALALAAYGAGAGLHSIARGTVPLTLFGADGYATLMGRLARPALAAGAAAPLLGALAHEALGTDGTLAMLTALALLNTALVAWLVANVRR